MAELIQKQDTLNEGRVKLNEAITDAERAKSISEQSDAKADQALGNSESTQLQLDTIVIEGDSSVEAAQARVDANGNAHTTLKNRVDSDYNELTQERDQVGTTTFTYDESGLISEIVSPTKTTTFEYSVNEEVVKITEIMGQRTIETTFYRNEDGTVYEIEKAVI